MNLVTVELYYWKNRYVAFEIDEEVIRLARQVKTEPLSWNNYHCWSSKILRLPRNKKYIPLEEMIKRDTKKMEEEAKEDEAKERAYEESYWG